MRREWDTFARKPPLGYGLRTDGQNEWVKRGLQAAYLLNEGGGLICKDLTGRYNGVANLRTRRSGLIYSGTTGPKVTTAVPINKAAFTYVTRFRLLSGAAIVGTKALMDTPGNGGAGTTTAGAVRLVLASSTYRYLGVLVCYANNASYNIITPQAVTGFAWHTAAITSDGTNVNLYYDGMFIGTIPRGATVGDARLISIGGYGATFANGEIDWACVYKRCLSPFEIRALSSGYPYIEPYTIPVIGSGSSAPAYRSSGCAVLIGA